WKVLVTDKQADLMEDLLAISRNGTYFDKNKNLISIVNNYQKTGYGGWIFLGVLDERSPVEEVELHGKIIHRGSQNERLALEVMCRTDCRARPVAWFNDPRLTGPKNTTRWSGIIGL
ncbi:hypothetical protein, partial [Methanoregula sp.]|uniref:hypothetical protein n=1 Tax=Methanoregula sp. TaxID=2052170 RepID=UPI000CC6F774